MKILPPDLGRDAKFAERFVREARALARLVHPGIVTIHDFGQAGDISYLVMEYMDGMSLRELMDADRIAPDEALSMFVKICEALQYAHDEGVVHRDIKPENILFDRRGHLKIADFGLAKLAVESTMDATLTGSRQAMGTLHYMAPEQWESPNAVDHRADIYALGVMLYEMLTGQLPMGSFEPPSAKCDVDPAIDDIVVRAMQRERENRFESIGAMARLIAPALEGQPLLQVDPLYGPPDGRGTFTRVVDAGKPAVSFARKMLAAAKAPTRRALKWRFPFGTLLCTIAVLILTSLPWINARDVQRDSYGYRHARSYEGWFCDSQVEGVLFANFLPMIAMAAIFLMTLLSYFYPLRAQLMSVAAAAYGVIHIIIFYAADGYVTSYHSTNAYEMNPTVAPGVVGVIMAGVLLDRLWAVDCIVDPEGCREWTPKALRPPKEKKSK